MSWYEFFVVPVLSILKFKRGMGSFSNHWVCKCGVLGEFIRASCFEVCIYDVYWYGGAGIYPLGTLLLLGNIYDKTLSVGYYLGVVGILYLVEFYA